MMDQQPSHPPFDVLTYISRYDKHSETYLQRCLFLGHCFHDIATTNNAATTTASVGGVGGGGGGGTNDAKQMAQLAFNLAINQMKEYGKYKRYCEEFGAAATTSTTPPPPNNNNSNMTTTTEGGMSGGGGSVIEDTMTHNPEEDTSSSYKAARLDDTSSNGGRNTIRNVINNSSSNDGGGGGGVSSSNNNTPTVIKTYTLLQPYISTQPYDSAYISQSTSLSKQRIDILEARLSTAQTKMQRDAIRSALVAIGEYNISIGDTREAYRRIVRAREYCTSGRQHGQINLLLLQLCIDLKEWNNVRNIVSRAEHTVITTSSPDDILMDGDTTTSSLLQSVTTFYQPKLRVALGLAYLAEGKYTDAATIFTSLSIELNTQFASVISAEDIALYGSILGLATMDRELLHGCVIDGIFKGRLELVPAIRDVLRHYSRAEYGQCLTLLHGTIKHDLLLDMHLHSHVPVLLDMIRDRCITQYLVPYSCVSIEKMGRVFGYTACNMERIVAKLLLNGELGTTDDERRSGKVRINARDGTLMKESTSLGEKKAVRKARVLAMKMGRQFTRETEGVLLRVMCMESGLVTPQSSDNKRSIGWRSSNNRGCGGRPHRDGGGGGGSSGRSIPNESMGSDLFEESDDDIDDIDDDDDDDGSISHDDMDVDNHNIVNPNEY